MLDSSYDAVVSVERDSNGQIVRGLALGDTLYQNQALILQLHLGELKEYPAVGCGIESALLDESPLMWRGLIREQLEMDGQRVERVAVTRQGIDIVASYM